MNTQISSELYGIALKKIEELLPQVSDLTPANDPKMVELCHFSDIVEEYEQKAFPISAPTFAQVIKERLEEKNMQKQTLAKAIGVSASRISDFLSEKAEPSLTQARNICRTLNIEPGIALQM